MDKVYQKIDEAIADVNDGAVIAQNSFTGFD
jgi:acyl CoA:acetate/3-ketoacid CoA transferase alpha subunit